MLRKVQFNYSNANISTVVDRNVKLYPTEQLTRPLEIIPKHGECKNRHTPSLSQELRSDFKKDCKFLELHDLCIKRGCSGQKATSFTPKQFTLEGTGIKPLV